LLGYELGRTLETLPQARVHDFETPEIWIGFFDVVVAWDHETGQAWLMADGHPKSSRSARSLHAQDRMARWRQLVLQGKPPGASPHPKQDPPREPHRLAQPLTLKRNVEVWSHFSRPTYQDAVAKAVEYIHAGDCFQVNLAQRLLARSSVSDAELYFRLRKRNPAPFAGFLDTGSCRVMSASPERFLRIEAEGKVETRPIKGTRPRGRNEIHDLALAQELRQSAKDRAENVMIVDLMRNDLGRVCEPGTVKVSEVCRLETYRTVHHLVSVVHGRLAGLNNGIDLLKATFPGGSVTGAPKIRSMEIITELEGVERGPYCGCLGWLGWDGQMDSNILIRTFTSQGGWLQFPVGGGIVADSVPEKEYEETLHKAEGLLRALEEKSGSGIHPQGADAKSDRNP